SDNQSSTQGATAQIRNWHFSNLDVGGSISISLTAKVDFPCVAAKLNNNVGVEGTHERGHCGEADAVGAHASAFVNCTQPDVGIVKVVNPKILNPGEEATVTLTISNPGG